MQNQEAMNRNLRIFKSFLKDASKDDKNKSSGTPAKGVGTIKKSKRIDFESTANSLLGSAFKKKKGEGTEEDTPSKQTVEEQEEKIFESKLTSMFYRTAVTVERQIRYGPRPRIPNRVGSLLGHNNLIFLPDDPLRDRLRSLVQLHPPPADRALLYYWLR